MRFLVVFALMFLLLPSVSYAAEKSPKLWQVQSVDTMKYSRDLSRQMLSKPEFDQVIDKHISLIAQTGATHVSIATPYDEEFIPILTRWVKSARSHGLKVWFRGNWSGWERWFDYTSISRQEHLAKTRLFIANHGSLFQSGDIFSSCPECENGGPGDPRRTGDVAGFRQFLIDLYTVSNEEFKKQNKEVITNYFSSNGDVTRLIMDKDTTQKLGGVVVVDHYVGTPEKLVSDLKEYSRLSGGKIVLGEFGAPLPDLHPGMDAAAQSEWLTKLLGLLADTPEVVGLNYWLSFGGSAKLWEDNGTPRPAVEALTKAYSPKPKVITFFNPIGEPIPSVTVDFLGRNFVSDRAGRVVLPYMDQVSTAAFTASNYKPTSSIIENSNDLKVILDRDQIDLIYRIKSWFYTLFKSWS